MTPNNRYNLFASWSSLLLAVMKDTMNKNNIDKKQPILY